MASLLFTQFIAWAPTCPSWREVHLFPKAPSNHLTWAGTWGPNSVQRRWVLQQKARKKEKTRKCDQWLGSQVGPAHSDVRKFICSCYNMPIDSALFFPSPSSVPLSSEATYLLDHTHMLSHFPLMLSTVPGGPWLGNPLSASCHTGKVFLRKPCSICLWHLSLPWDHISISQQRISLLHIKRKDRCC